VDRLHKLMRRLVTLIGKGVRGFLSLFKGETPLDPPYSPAAGYSPADGLFRCWVGFGVRGWCWVLMLIG
jgi:hypothetical protein